MALSAIARACPTRRRRLLAGVFVLVSLAALALASPTAAASPCANQVLADWDDNGRIDGIYNLSCYQSAIDAIPSDIRDYADAEEVIARALQEASRKSGVGKQINPTAPIQRSIDRPSGTGDVIPVANASAQTALPTAFLALAGMSLMLLAAGTVGHLLRRRRSG